MLRGTLLKSKNTKGFTIVEVLAIILVVGILSTIGVVSFQGAQKNTRDSQRVNQITIIAEALEKYYDKNGQYPDCPTLLGDLSPLKDIDQKVLIAPKSNSASVACSTPSATNDVFYYNFNVGDGSWKLEYFNEGQNTSKIAVSSRRITAIIPNPSLPVLDAPTLTATKNGKFAIDLSWGTYTPNNSTKFIINYYTSASFPAAFTNVKTLTSDTLSYQMTSLNAGTKYYVRIKAMGDNISYADSVFSSTVNATTDPDFYTMSASVTPAGSGTISGVANPYNIGAAASITANAGSGYQFSFWENCSSSAAATISITMNSDKTCIAHFVVKSYVLTFSVQPAGSGDIKNYTNNVVGSSLIGNNSFSVGDRPKAIAVPASGYFFVNWSGCNDGVAPYTILAFSDDIDETCVAHFAHVSISLSEPTIFPGQNAEITATSSVDLSPTIYYLKIYDSNTGSYLASTGSSDTLTHTANPTSDTVYMARVTNYDGSIVYGYASVTEVVSSFSIVASTTSISSGGSVDITAYSDVDLAYTPWYMEIYDESGNSVLVSEGTAGYVKTTTYPNNGTPTYTNSYIGRIVDINNVVLAYSNRIGVLVNAVATTVAAPAKPGLTAAYDTPTNMANSTVTAVACSTAGSVAQYQEQHIVTNGTWSGWSAWSTSLPNKSIAITNQGDKETFIARARCYKSSTATASAVSSTAQAIATRPVANAVFTSFQIKRGWYETQGSTAFTTDNNYVTVQGNVTCGTGASLYSTGDIYSGTSDNKWVIKGVTKSIGWYAASNDGLLLQEGFGYRTYYSNSFLSMTARTPNIIYHTGDIFGMKLWILCKNKTTGVTSPNQVYKETTTLSYPAL